MTDLGNQNRFRFNEIGGGYFGSVHELSDDHVAKILYGSNFRKLEQQILDGLENEAIIARSLKKDGFPVPISYGVNYITIDLGDNRPITLPAHIMENIHGERLADLNNSYSLLDRLKSWKILRKGKKYLKRAKKLGYRVPVDSLSQSNIIVKNNQPILVDFGNWKMPEWQDLKINPHKYDLWC